MPARPRADLFACAALGVAGIAAGVHGALPTVAAAPLALALGLLVPGWAVQALAAPPRLGGAERLLLALVASLAASVAVALALSTAGPGIHRQGVLVADGAVALVLALAALVAAPQPAGPILDRPAVATLALAALALGGTVALSERATPALRADGAYTLLGAERTATGVHLTVRSAERARTGYRLVVRIGRQRPALRTLALAPGASSAVDLAAGARDPVAVVLERAGAPGVTYRRVRLRGA